MKTYKVNIAKDGKTFRQSLNFADGRDSRANLNAALKFAENYIRLFIHYPKLVLDITCNQDKTGSNAVWDSREPLTVKENCECYGCATMRHACIHGNDN